jgi:large subunit ribosomal protein L24
MAAKIRNGDTVRVLVGKNKGAEGRVLRIDRRAGVLVVEGVNVVKRHTRPSQQHGRGGIVEKEAPIQISNVAVLHNGEPTRIGFRVRDGKKVRFSKTHGEAIDE